MKTEANVKNIKLEHNTKRALNLQEVQSRSTGGLRPPPVSLDELRFDPAEPTFGLLAQETSYSLVVKIVNAGSDVTRFRLLQCPTSALIVVPSTTRLVPGLPASLKLSLSMSSHPVGPFSYRFSVVGETAVHHLTVSGQCLAPEDYRSIMLLNKIEGRTTLAAGVRVQRAGPGAAAAAASSSLASSTLAGGGVAVGVMSLSSDVESPSVRDSVLSFFPPPLLEDIQCFPTFPSTYYDPLTDSMRLLQTTSLLLPPTTTTGARAPAFNKAGGGKSASSASAPDHFVGADLTLDSLRAEARRREQQKMQAVESSGGLSSRCLEGLRDGTGMIGRDVFRNMSKSNALGGGTS